MTARELPEAADALFEVPPERFVEERNRVARELKADPEAASAVKALRRPTAAAWVVNQLARRHRGDVDALLQAGRSLLRAQEALLAGGDAAAVRRAKEEERRRVDELVEAGLEIAGEAGIAAGATLRERVAQTLFAAATDDEARELIASGRLDRERQPSGFGGLLETEVPSDAPRPRAKQGARALEEAGERAERRAREALAARTQADDARRAADELGAESERLRALADEATARAEEAEARAREARRAARAAAEQAEAAARAATRAAERLEELRR